MSEGTRTRGSSHSAAGCGTGAASCISPNGSTPNNRRGWIRRLLQFQITPSGWPAISYNDNTNNALKYTYKHASGWHPETVDSGGTVGEFTSLQLTPAGWPAISYYDSTNNALKYTYKSAS